VGAVAERGSADFQRFLKEVNDHFVHVVGERLGWKVLERPSWTSGNGNVVLRFRTAQGLFIFRVPKYSQFQLRSVALAYHHFAHLGVMPEVVYRDGKCVLERYMPGVPLSAASSDEVLCRLARTLAQLHTLPATGFGRLTHGTTGWFTDATAWSADNAMVLHSGHRGEADEPDAQEAQLVEALTRRIAELPDAMRTAPVWVSHGDLWRSNVIVGPEGRVTLIDWDTMGAYPRENDLTVVVDADLDARQKALFLEAYGHPVDEGLLRWIALCRIVRNPGARLREKLAKVRQHGLLD
jgi:aminoglycoside phosphotransferase